MPTREDRGYCRECERPVLVRQETPNHILHLLLSVLLCGLWFPVWMIITLNGNGSWYCSKCGSDDISEA